MVAAALCGALAAPVRADEAASATSIKGPWQPVRSDNGITVVRRTVAGTQLHEFQGTGIIEAPISVVMAVLNDTDHRREWMKESKEQRTLQQVNDRMVILYNRIGAPWPVADRDSVLRAVTVFDTRNKLVRIEIVSTTHPDAPPVKGAVRMPFMVAHWYLWPVEGGKWTRAEYQVHADPGGSLPDWLINLVSKKIPHDTISALREQVKRRRYPELEAKLEALPEYRAVVSTEAAAAPPAAPPPAPTPAH
jgi:hypothetical protein